MSNAIALPTFAVEKRPLFDAAGNAVKVFGMFRTDNDQFLAPVGRGYQPIQNHAVYDLVDKLRSDGIRLDPIGGVEYDGGRKIVLQYRMGERLTVKTKSDVTEFRLSFLIHHGIGAVYNFVEAMRLICTNGAMIKQSYRALSVSHRGNIDGQLSDGRETLRLATKTAAEYGRHMNALANVKMDSRVVAGAIRAIWPNVETDEKSQEQARAALVNFEHNDGTDGITEIRGTAWNFLNGITQYADHQMMRESTRADAAAHLHGRLFGAAHVLKMHAMDTLVQHFAIK